jgi:DNA-binding PadR family transcriptional regulator
LRAAPRFRDEGRRIRVYRLTAAGRRQLSHEINSWRLFAAAITQVVDAQ